MKRLRYFGGSFASTSRPKCSSCSGKAATSRARIMSESIQYPSDVTPNGLKTTLFSVGRDYFVTEYEAEYLLKMTFVNINGKTEPKFKEIKDGRQAE